MDRGAWRATALGVAKEPNTTFWLKNNKGEQYLQGVSAVPQKRVIREEYLQGYLSLWDFGFLTRDWISVLSSDSKES